MSSAVASLDLGLQRVHAVLESLHNPHASFPALHVAGTNGKGSTCAVLDSILRAAGYRVGLFVSPFLVEPRDAVRIDGVTVSPAAWRTACERVEQASQQALAGSKEEATESRPLGPLTTFELWTCAAFLLFHSEAVEVAVIEVGLGGRLDATNVLPTPACAVITNLGMDHMAQLGPTLTHIAYAKAGILKPGGVCVLSSEQRVEAQAEVVRCAREQGTGALVLGAVLQEAQGEHLTMSCTEFTQTQLGQHVSFPAWPSCPPLFLPLPGPHQRINAGTALTVCRILRGDRGVGEVLHGVLPEPPSPASPLFSPSRLTDAAMAAGLARVAWPGRLQAVRLPTAGGGHRSAVLDGGHNEHAVPALAASLSTLASRAGATRLYLLFACGSTRDGASFLAGLVQHVQAQGPAVGSIDIACLPYTSPEGMPWASCMDPAALAAAVEGKGQVLGQGTWRVTHHASLQEGWEHVQGRLAVYAAQDGGADSSLVCLLGSLYLVSDVHRWLATTS